MHVLGRTEVKLHGRELVRIEMKSVLCPISPNPISPNPNSPHPNSRKPVPFTYFPKEEMPMTSN